MLIPLLFDFIQILVLVLVALWVMIGISIFYRKIRTKQLLQIENTFATIAAGYLYPATGKEIDLIQIQRKLRKVGVVPNKAKNVQFLIDLMIRTQRSLLGENYDKLVVLFYQIPPYGASGEKLASKKWYIKARGIREIYEMNQENQLKNILKQRNDKNIYVRREAQIALVIFLGWDSLRFLSVLSREMTLWQQIKIVEKLYSLYPEPNLNLLRKTYSAEKNYANELIMRIIKKFKLISEMDYILQFIDSPEFDMREAAIYCLCDFKVNGDKLEILKNKLGKIANIEQQIQIIKYINQHSKVKDLQFNKSLLYNPNDTIKLTAAEILWNSGYKEEVQDFYYQQYNKESVLV